jgi:hypothetical protein
MLHVIRFITAFGAPKGYNASRPESHHKNHAKDPGRRSQKNAETIDRQCGQRVADAYMINSMHQLFHAKEQAEELQDTSIANEPNETLIESSGKTAMQYDICSVRDAISGTLICTTKFHTKSKAVMRLEPNLDLFVLQHYSSQLTPHGEGTVSACTEYHLANYNREAIITLRCHPNYRGEGAWYDWAVIRFIDDNDVSTDYPSRIVACIPKVLDGESNSIKFDLIVQCCTHKTGQESILYYTAWMFDVAFYVVPGSALVSACFVLKASDTDFDRVLVVLDNSLWATKFYAAANYAPSTS